MLEMSCSEKVCVKKPLERPTQGMSTGWDR